MQDETYAYFLAFGYAVESSVVTGLLGLEPTQVFVAGQPKPGAPKVVSRENLWQLHSPLPRSACAEAHIEALLDLLESRSKAIALLVDVHHAKIGINCAIYYQDFMPGIHLSPDLIGRAASLGLHLDLDLYFFGEEERAQE